MSNTTISQIPASRPNKDSVRRARNTWDCILNVRVEILFDSQVSTENKQAIRKLVHEELENIREFIRQRQNKKPRHRVARDRNGLSQEQREAQCDFPFDDFEPINVKP